MVRVIIAKERAGASDVMVSPPRGMAVAPRAVLGVPREEVGAVAIRLADEIREAYRKRVELEREGLVPARADIA